MKLQYIKETVSIDLEDGVICTVQDSEPIRDQDDYGGVRVKVLCQLENIKQVVPLDIATGDPVTPSPIKYEYETLFGAQKIPLMSYNLETMLAKKNSFAKDIKFEDVIDACRDLLNKIK